MIPLPYLANKTVAVLGLGKTGEATVDALLDSGARVVVWDDNMATRATFSAAHPNHIVVEPPAQWMWDTIDLVVASPGLPYTHPAPHEGIRLAQEHGVAIVGDIELLYRSCPDATYIAITGTNGKSTTTSLIAHILSLAGKQVQVGGNLGTPALSFTPLEADGIYVLELSSYQLDLVRTTHFDVSVLMNLSPDHLDRHGDKAGYIAAKCHIFDRQERNDVAIIGVDDAASEALCREMIAAGQQRVVPIMTTQTTTKGIWVKEAVLHNPLASPEAVCDLASIVSLQGEHNHQNAAAAYAACWSIGLPHEVIVQGLTTFPGLDHRMQFIAEHQGVRYINDSKATNADAAEKSLKTFDRIHWIIGGVAKSGGIEPLAKYFPKIVHAYLIGDAQDVFAKTLEGQVPYSRSGTLEQAFSQAAANAKAGEVVLLAPACASFDQFKSFEFRGRAFADLVRAYIHQKGRISAV